MDLKPRSYPYALCMALTLPTALWSSQPTSNLQKDWLFKELKHDWQVTSVAFLPDKDKKCVAFSGHDCVKLWDVDTEECKPAFTRADGFKSISLSGDGKWLASACGQKVLVWDVNNGNCKAELAEHSEDVYCVSFSPDEKWLASGSFDNSVRLWQLDSSGTWGYQAQLAEHTSTVSSVAFSPDGKWLASGSFDESVRLWEVNSSGTWACRTELRHPDVVHSVAFSPDGKWLASGSVDGSVRLWEVKSSGISDTCKVEAKYNQPIFCVSFSADGQWLAAGGQREEPQSVFSPDNEWVRYVYPGNLWLWELGGKQRKIKLEGHRQNVTSVSFSPDGGLLASGAQDGKVRLWDISSLRSEQVIGLKVGESPNFSGAPSHSNPPNSQASGTDNADEQLEGDEKEPRQRQPPYICLPDPTRDDMKTRKLKTLPRDLVVASESVIEDSKLDNDLQKSVANSDAQDSQVSEAVTAHPQSKRDHDVQNLSDPKVASNPRPARITIGVTFMIFIALALYAYSQYGKNKAKKALAIERVSTQGVK